MALPWEEHMFNDTFTKIKEVIKGKDLEAYKGGSYYDRNKGKSH